MKLMEANSVDTIISDPPYGLSFMGKKWDYDVPSVELWQECLRVLKPGGTALIFAGSRTQHRMAVNVEDAGFTIKDCIMWLYGSGFPKAMDISKQLDKGHERKVVGKRNVPDQRSGGINSQRTAEIGVPTREVDITEPATPEAKLWNGWKSHGLKPAYEPILVAMKPNDGTYANNALKHGVSGLNIDGGRIGTEEDTRRPSRGGENGLNGSSTFKIRERRVEDQVKQSGRFPANIILDEEAGKMLDEQSGQVLSNLKKKGTTKPNTFVSGGSTWNEGNTYNDKGGASRFFYCAKASKKERNAGCEDLEGRQYSHDGRKKEIENPYQRNKSVARNHHPTVKPIKLMEYLCTLTKTPTGGTVLDPFMGSGTTGIACKNTGRDFIGIERDPEYFKIANARIHKAKEGLGI